MLMPKKMPIDLVCFAWRHWAQKEGAAAGITAIIGKDITNVILQTSGRSDQQDINDYSLHPFTKAVIDGAYRPATKDVCKKFGALVATQFDFRQKMVTNVEHLHSKAANINTYGVTFCEDVIFMIILSNVEWAARQLWGGKHRLALQKICHNYSCDTVHNVTSYTALTKELAVADGAHDRRKAKSPGGIANAVENSMSILQGLVNYDNTNDLHHMEKRTQRTPIANPRPTNQNTARKRNTKRRTGDHCDDNLHPDRHPTRPRHHQGGVVQPLVATNATRKGDTIKIPRKNDRPHCKQSAPQSASRPTPGKVELEQEVQGCW